MTFHLKHQLGWRNHLAVAVVSQVFYYYFTIGWSQGAGCGMLGSSRHLSLNPIEMHPPWSDVRDVLMAKWLKNVSRMRG